MRPILLSDKRNTLTGVSHAEQTVGSRPATTAALRLATLADWSAPSGRFADRDKFAHTGKVDRGRPPTAALRLHIKGSVPNSDQNPRPLSPKEP